MFGSFAATLVHSALGTGTFRCSVALSVPVIEKKSHGAQTSPDACAANFQAASAQTRGFCYPWEITSHFSASASQSPSDNLSQP